MRESERASEDGVTLDDDHAAPSRRTVSYSIPQIQQHVAAVVHNGTVYDIRTPRMQGATISCDLRRS